MRFGDWHIAAKSGDNHIVIVPVTAKARGIRPPMLIRLGLLI
jgi:hypothetical protein